LPDPAQFQINQRHQPVEGVLPAKLQLGELLGNFSARVDHASQPFQQS